MLLEKSHLINESGENASSKKKEKPVDTLEAPKLKCWIHYQKTECGSYLRTGLQKRHENPQQQSTTCNKSSTKANNVIAIKFPPSRDNKISTTVTYRRIIISQHK